MSKVNEALAEGRARLQGEERDAALEAVILLAHALNRSRTWLYAWPEKALSEREYQAYLDLLRRREAGEPISYITGTRGFWSLELKVTPATLIPRPETERLVELALQGLPQNALVADLGTGSGAIALALATERPDLMLFATDADPEALEVARGNARELGLTLDFAHGNWCEPLPPESFDLIVSNPPYVAETDPHLLQGDLRFEPRQALAAGPDGLDDIRIIAASSMARLKTGGAC